MRLRCDSPTARHVASCADIEGDGCPSGRSSVLLLTGAVNLKYHGCGMGYFARYGDLQPWVHYVPIKPDLSDLLDTIRYLRANDDMAREIGQRGRAFALANFSTEALDCYIADFVRRLADVQTSEERLEVKPELFDDLTDSLVTAKLPTRSTVLGPRMTGALPETLVCYEHRWTNLSMDEL